MEPSPIAEGEKALTGAVLVTLPFALTLAVVLPVEPLTLTFPLVLPVVDVPLLLPLVGLLLGFVVT